MSYRFELKTSTKLKIARFLYLAYKFLGFKTNLVAKRLGILFNLELNEAIDSSLYFSGTYENDLIEFSKKIVKPGMIIFDIGANCGVHTLHLASLLKGTGSIYAFEATDYAFGRLQKNLELNPTLKTHVYPVQVYLKDQAQDALETHVAASWDIDRRVDDQDRHLLNGGFLKEVTKTQLTLDSWVSLNQIQKLDLIKLDVDGNEVIILRGAQNTIKSYRPLIIMELSPIHFEDRQDTFIEQVDLISRHGYDFFDMKGRQLPNEGALLQKLIPRGVLINVLCRPK